MIIRKIKCDDYNDDDDAREVKCLKFAFILITLLCNKYYNKYKKFKLQLSYNIKKKRLLL